MELPWGAFGENFTTEGLLERDVRIGDRFEVGTAELQVTDPRMPCYKLGVRFDRDDMVKRFLASGGSGFYLAVLREGEVAAGRSDRARGPGGARGDDRGRRGPPARAVARAPAAEGATEMAATGRSWRAPLAVAAGALVVVHAAAVRICGPRAPDPEPRLARRDRPAAGGALLRRRPGSDPHSAGAGDPEAIRRHRDLLPHRRSGRGASGPRPADQGRGARGRESLLHDQAHGSVFRRRRSSRTWTAPSGRRRSPARRSCSARRAAWPCRGTCGSRGSAGIRA